MAFRVSSATGWITFKNFYPNIDTLTYVIYLSIEMNKCVKSKYIFTTTREGLFVVRVNQHSNIILLISRELQFIGIIYKLFSLNEK